jgi:hypothetical protein
MKNINHTKEVFVSKIGKDIEEGKKKMPSFTKA